MNNEFMFNAYELMVAGEMQYDKYKNMNVPTYGYLVYDLIGHTGEYCIQYKKQLIEVDSDTQTCS